MDSQSGTAMAYGRWQGAHWRRLCRTTAGSGLGVLTVLGWTNSSLNFAQGLTTLGFVSCVFVSYEYMFARRMGMEVRPDSLALRGPFRQVQVPWPNVQGFIWKEQPSLSRTKYLYVRTDQKKPRRLPGDSPLRIPTVASVFDSSLPNDRILGPLLTSPNVRANDGREVDALELLEWARERADRETASAG